MLHLNEKMRYLVSGCLSACASWAAMALCAHILFGGSGGLRPWQHGVCGFANWAAGMLCAYILNRSWVFRTAGTSGAGREFFVFLVSRLGTLCIDQVLRQILSRAGIGLYLESAVVLVIITVLNYILGKRVVFLHQNKSKM